MAAKKPTGSKWMQEDLQNALVAIEENKMSIRKAANVYGIPKSTLYGYVKGDVVIGSRRGPPTVLTSSEENMLVNWAVKMVNIGYGRTRQQICEMVKKLLEKDNRPNPFTDNLPGKDWWYAFLRRHPQLTMRSPEPLQLARATACTEEAIRRWYVEFGQFLQIHGVVDPSCVWNADETGCPLCPSTGKVLCLSGTKDVYQITGSNKEQLTTLCAISASGNIIPPMHVFPGQRFKYNPLDGCVPGAYFGKSLSGWMTTELFYGWIANHFALQIPPQRPVVLLVDGHSTHIDIETSRFCQENSILLYCLPPHSSHITQPLDVGFYGPFKQSWKKAVAEFNVENLGKSVTKETFAAVFRKAYDDTVKVGTIVNAFRNSGIFPVNFEAIRSGKFTPSSIYSSESVTTKTSEVQKKPQSSEKSALKTIEEIMCSSTKKRFKSRYEEGYDVHGDEFYTVWAKLKQLSLQGDEENETVDTNASEKTSMEQECHSSASAPLMTGSSVLDEILTYPKLDKQKKKKRGGQTHLPSHLSSTQMIRLLQEKEELKMKEEEDKLKRKKEREAKKKQKEEEREAKRKKRIEEQARRERERAQKSRGQPKRKTRKRSPSPPPSPSPSPSSSPSVSDDNVSDTICPGCDTNRGLDWVACDLCNTWYHRECTNIPPEEYDIVADITWYCPVCDN